MMTIVKRGIVHGVCENTSIRATTRRLQYHRLHAVNLLARTLNGIIDGHLTGDPNRPNHAAAFAAVKSLASGASGDWLYISSIKELKETIGKADCFVGCGIQRLLISIHRDGCCMNWNGSESVTGRKLKFWLLDPLVDQLWKQRAEAVELQACVVVLFTELLPSTVLCFEHLWCKAGWRQQHFDECNRLR